MKIERRVNKSRFCLFAAGDSRHNLLYMYMPYISRTDIFAISVLHVHGGSGRFRPPNANKSPRKSKRAPANCHRLQCKSLFNVADLVNGMWKVAPKNKNLFFGLVGTIEPEVLSFCTGWMQSFLFICMCVDLNVSIQNTSMGSVATCTCGPMPTFPNTYTVVRALTYIVHVQVHHLPIYGYMCTDNYFIILFIICLLSQPLCPFSCVLHKHYNVKSIQ